MAYRKRPDIKSSRKVVNASYSPDGKVVVGPYNVNIIDKYESMESDDDPTYKGYKPVDHVKVRLLAMRPGASQRYFRDGTVGDYTYRKRYLSVFSTRFDPVIAFQSKLEGAFVTWLGDNPIDWDAVTRKAIPSLRNQFNTINFLAELDDIPDLIRSITKNYKNLREHKVFYSSFRGFAPDRLVSDIAQVLADGTLAMNLGVDPLISDAEDLARNAQAFFNKADKRARMIDRYIRKIRQGIRCTARVGTIPIELYHESDGTTGGTIRWSLVGDLKIRATCRVIGDGPIDNPLAAFLDNAGIYPDLHTLWNAVPFSFILDYVSPIGDTLEREYGEWSWQHLDKQRAGLQIIDAVVSATFEGRYHYEEWGTMTPQMLVNPPSEPYSISSSAFWTDIDTHIQEGRYRWYHRFLPHDPQIDGSDVNRPILHLPWKNKQWKNLSALLISPIIGVTRPSWVKKKKQRTEYLSARWTRFEREEFVKLSLKRVNRSAQRRRK